MTRKTAAPQAQLSSSSPSPTSSSARPGVPGPTPKRRGGSQVEDMQDVMENPRFIRNLSVIAHVDHGKTTLTDSLVASSGLMRKEAAGDACVTETRKDERERGITIKSTGISMLCQVPSTGDPLLINLVDSPGHVDFSSEVTSALRVTDGALVVVDCIEGVRVQTVTVVRQALAQRVKPILVLNKLDRPFCELQKEPEDIYQSLVRTIESVNVIIATAQPQGVDWTVSPDKGSVVFAAAAQAWGFTLDSFAAKYAGKVKSVQRLAEMIWGEHFYDDATGQWSSSSVSPSGKPLERGFNKFVLQPIAVALEKGRTVQVPEELASFAEAKLKVHMTSDEVQQLNALDQKHRIKSFMSKWLPLDAALLESIAVHLPSPVQASIYRAEYLYTGPDDATLQSMKACNPTGPLVVYISKMVPDEGSHSSRFFAFGRVFSGTASCGQKVDVIDGNTGSRASDKAIQRVLMAQGKSFVSIGSVCAGNTVMLVGVDQYLTKNGTVVASGTHSFPLRPMTFSVSAVVRAAVQTSNPADLPKLLEALRRLGKSDQLLTIQHTTSGEHIVAAAGELHLEIALHDLRDFLKDAGAVPESLKVSDPAVPYLETVVSSGAQVLSKSGNKLNRIFMKAESLPSELVSNLDESESESKSVSFCAKQFGWTTSESKKFWAVGPTFAASESSATPTCLLVDATKGVQYLTEVKDSVMNGFLQAVREGPLLSEPVRGVKVDLTDALIHADSRHRGVSQISLASRRATLAAILSCSPRLVEPIYLAEIACQRSCVGSVYAVLGRRRGQIRDEVDSGSSGVVIRSYLPVAESFGFNEELREQTQGQAFPQLTMDHWSIIDEDPLQPGTSANKLLKKLRRAKGLREDPPQLSDFADKL